MKEKFINVSAFFKAKSQLVIVFLREKTLLLAAALLVLVFAAVILAEGFDYFRYRQDQPIRQSRDWQYELSDQAPSYTEAQSIVDSSISQSAAIAIKLPDGVDEATAKDRIEFAPQIKGQWLDEGTEKKLAYRPAEKLVLGNHYAVTLKLDEGVIGGDFVVEEDPRIISVFPKDNSETHEETDITILFNRPMVPLSSLEVMATESIPVEIEPATAGRFKWIGTRTLKFLPETALKRSSNYTVKIGSAFRSMDGLRIESLEHKFKTRNLRYEYISRDNTVYNEPIRIGFNQPVDLERTKAEIWLKNTLEDRRIDFIVEYGTKRIFNEELKKYEETEDKSVLNVYNKVDRHGRAKLWDFENRYFLRIQKAYPLEGDIDLAQGKETSIKVSGVINDISALSDRSTWVSSDLFDPTGQLVVEFFEEVDKDKSQIKGNKLQSFDFGQKCKEAEGLVFANENDCEKETDRKKLLFTFDQEKIKKGERLELDFEKIVNLEGLTINAEKITETIKIIPEPRVISTVPAAGDKTAVLTEFYLCTNVPLISPAKEDRENYLTANQPFEYEGWYNSRKIPDDGGSYWKCKPGEFQTDIRYGLIPENDYEMKFNLEDHFSGKTEHSISFRTQAMPDRFLNFFHFQERVILTTPDKTKLTYAAENMEFVDLNICRLSPEDMVKTILNQPQYSAGPEAVKVCAETKNVRIDLEKKYWVKNYFQIDLKDYIDDIKGHYLLTFSNPNYYHIYNKQEKVHERTFVSVTDIGITEKKIDIRDIKNRDLEPELRNLVWVNDLKSLKPLDGAEVKIFDENENNQVKEKNIVRTDGRGIAEFKAEGTSDALVVRHGSDSAILVNQQSSLEEAQSAVSAARIYTYSDRPIYRPGDMVGIKGIYRIGYDNDYEIFRDKPLVVRVFDSQKKLMIKQEAEISEFGTFAFTLTLPADASLGKYSIETDNSYSTFDVEEYTPSAFKVDLSSGQDEYISGDTVEVEIDAAYYFGAPVDEAEVEYSIGSQDYHFDRYNDGHFSFGSGWYDCYWYCEYNDRFILRNKTKLDAEGKGKISHLIDLKAFFKDETELQSKIFVVYATVKNQNGQSVSAQKSFIIHNGEFYLGLNTDKSFLGQAEKFELQAKSVDSLGKSVAVDDIDLSLNRIEWLSVKRKEVDGGYYYSYEQKLIPVISEKIKTDKNGDFKKQYALSENGEYKIVVKGADDRGNVITNSYWLYVYGEGQASIMPVNDDQLAIEADNQELEVGGQGEIIIKSPYPRAKALISLERGRIFEYEIVDINQSLYNYKFDVKEDYIPNIFASVTLLSPDPGLKYGSKQFRVNTKERALDIEVRSDKDHYLPGEEVRLNIRALDSRGQGVSAELSVAVADLSVLALKGNPKKNPLVFFYGGFPLTVTTASNFKNILYEIDVSDGTKGGGGAEAEDLSKKKRGVFRDTAVWESTVRTDERGEATLEFTLPDNLTTWQIEALGVTKDTKLGVEYAEFTARKDLMLTPFVPRFVVPGDEFAVGAKIFNQTDEVQDLVVSLDAGTLEALDQKPVEIRIPAKKNDIVYFRVKAPDLIEKGRHTFVISARNEQLEDTVEQSVKIRPNDTYETTATAGYSNKEALNEYVYLPENVLPDKGGLTVNTSATLAVFLSEGLNSLISYPYGCSEQIASKLDAIAVIKRGLNLENVGDKFKLDDIEYEGRIYTIDELMAIGLKDIYATQNHDGGFSYYPNAGESSYYLSLRLAGTLSNLLKAGYEVDGKVLKKLFSYIQSATLYNRGEYGLSDERFIYAAAVLADLSDYGTIKPNILETVRSLEKKDKFINEDISSLALSQLALFLGRYPQYFSANYKNKVIDNLENRIEIDSRGAFLPARENRSWYYYETPVKNTAVLLQALIRDKRDNNLLDRVLRWLLQSRAKDGAWGSTSNSLSAISALVDYLIWQEENKSEFNLKLSLDGQPLADYSFAPANLFEQKSLGLKTAEIGLGKMSRLTFAKSNLNQANNNFYYDLSLRYYLPANSIPPRDEGFAIERGLFRPSDKKFSEPLQSANVGDVLKGQLRITVPKERNFVSVEDFIPAGFELVNFNLATENDAAVMEYQNTGEENSDAFGQRQYYGESEYIWWGDWQKNRQLIPSFQETHDDRLFLFNEHLRPGEYEFEYYIRALIPGRFQWLPAQIQEMYFPENFGRTGGSIFVVNEKKE